DANRSPELASSELPADSVAPSLVRSSVWIPCAVSRRRIISPIIADSLESLEEPTTAAGSGGDTLSASAAATHSDFRMFATPHSLPTARGRRSRSAAHCRLSPRTSRAARARVPARTALYHGGQR